MPVGDRQPLELLLDEAAWAREPARCAAKFGHDVRWDPGRLPRWTCVHCGNAVLVCGVNIYGSAVQEHCPAGVDR